MADTTEAEDNIDVQARLEQMERESRERSANEE